MKAYPVPPGFWHFLEQQIEESGPSESHPPVSETFWSVRAFLESSRPVFPPGATAQYLPEEGLLVASNLPEAHQLIAPLLSAVWEKWERRRKNHPFFEKVTESIIGPRDFPRSSSVVVWEGQTLPESVILELEPLD